MSTNNVVQFPAQPPQPDSKPVEPAAAEVLDGLQAMFRAAGCPDLADAFVIEAGGRCG